MRLVGIWFSFGSALVQLFAGMVLYMSYLVHVVSAATSDTSETSAAAASECVALGKILNVTIAYIATGSLYF